MKKALALFLALNMAVGLLLVPAAAYNEEDLENGFRWLEWEWAQDGTPYPTALSEDTRIYNEVWESPDDVILIQPIVDGQPLDSIDGLSVDDGRFDVYFRYSDTYHVYAEVHFYENYSQADSETRIYYGEGDERVELVHLVCHLGNGWRIINWQHVTEGDYQYVQLFEVEDGLNRWGCGHKGDQMIWQLIYDDDTLPENANVWYEQYEGNDEDIQVDFEYVEDYGLTAMISFNEWGAKGWIMYQDSRGVLHRVTHVECDGWGYYDGYENLNDRFPTSYWNYYDEGSVLYIRDNGGEQLSFVKNADAFCRLCYDDFGWDNDAIEVSYGEDEDYGGAYIMLRFREPPRGNGELHVYFPIRFHNGWTDWQHFGIRIVNHAPRLVWLNGDWDEYGNSYTCDESDGWYAVSSDELGSWGWHGALVLFEGYNDDGNEVYSDWLTPEQLSWRRVDSENENGLDIFWDKDLLCLVPWEYGEYEVSYTDNHGDTYSIMTGFVPQADLCFRSESGQPGKTVTVPVTIGNMDLVCASLGLTLWFDEDSLEFISCDSDVLDMTHVEVGKFDDHVNLAWGVRNNCTFEVGTELMRLTFYVKEGGDDYHVGVWGLETDADSFNSCYDEDGWGIPFGRNDFDIRVDEHIAGDLNLDGFVTTDDALCLLKWLVQRDDHGIADEMMDHLCVSGRDQVSLYDVTRLLQYVAGWNVEIYY